MKTQNLLRTSAERWLRIIVTCVLSGVGGFGVAGALSDPGVYVTKDRIEQEKLNADLLHGANSQAYCEGQLGRKLWHRGECHDFDVISIAPRIYLHQDEAFFPSSVPFFLTQVDDRDGHLVTKQTLGCPECFEPSFLKGEKPTATYTPPVYTMIVPKKDDVIDVVYWTFYPYNRGKRVCVGIWSKIWNGCLGGYKTFGNHVGDWEHFTVRFIGLEPKLIYLSTHSSGATVPWKDPSIQYSGDHPVLYSAKGSHGLYRQPGNVTYRHLSNGDWLYDSAGAGVAWDTWNNVQPMVFVKGAPFPKGFDWLGYAGRWGNPKDGCGIYEKISNECLLNAGPRGPAFKGAVLLDGLE